MLQVKNISFAYDENPTLHDISMDFEEGRITGILGVNGSGKYHHENHHPTAQTAEGKHFI